MGAASARLASRNGPSILPRVMYHSRHRPGKATCRHRQSSACAAPSRLRKKGKLRRKKRKGKRKRRGANTPRTTDSYVPSPRLPSRGYFGPDACCQSSSTLAASAVVSVHFHWPMARATLPKRPAAVLARSGRRDGCFSGNSGLFIGLDDECFDSGLQCNRCHTMDYKE
jgi:hypothetical protein